MAAMFALVSGILLGMTPLLIVDAIGRHRRREVSFSTVITIVAAVACYACLNELPNAHHEHPRYWNAACVFGVLIFGFFTAWTSSSATHKKKR